MTERGRGRQDEAAIAGDLDGVGAWRPARLRLGRLVLLLGDRQARTLSTATESATTRPAVPSRKPSLRM